MEDWKTKRLNAILQSTEGCSFKSLSRNNKAVFYTENNIQIVKKCLMKLIHFQMVSLLILFIFIIGVYFDISIDFDLENNQVIVWYLYKNQRRYKIFKI